MVVFVDHLAGRHSYLDSKAVVEPEAAVPVEVSVVLEELEVFEAVPVEGPAVLEELEVFEAGPEEGETGLG